MRAKANSKKLSSIWSRSLIIVGISIVLLVEAFCGLQVHILSAKQKKYKIDYSVINNVSFGLLSVDVWRDQFVSAAQSEIKDYRLTPSQQQEMKKEIEKILHGLVDKAFAQINKPQHSLGGKIKKMAVHAMVDSNKIQADVPAYSAKIMTEVTSPSSYHRIENIADTAVQRIGKKTYDSSTAVTKKTMDSIFVTYNVHDKESFEKVNAAFLIEIKKQTYSYCFGMLGSILFIILIWWIVRNKKEVYATLYVLSVIAALILLLVGLTTTMIEIDARIATMDFHLLGQSVSFKNQDLFFQSKSIIDVVVLLLKTGKVESEIVGVLIMCFSVLFPFMKLVSTGLSINSESKLAKNKVIHYFAFDSGKWSMADVMVVAILMTFIGFNGIVENTLSDLNIHSQSITSITTNNTSIQPGYIIFIGFVLFGFILSIILKRITGTTPKTSPKKQIA
jgi:hypothetical protein